MKYVVHKHFLILQVGNADPKDKPRIEVEVLDGDLQSALDRLIRQAKKKGIRVGNIRTHRKHAALRQHAAWRSTTKSGRSVQSGRLFSFPFFELLPID